MAIALLSVDKTINSKNAGLLNASLDSQIAKDYFSSKM